MNNKLPIVSTISYSSLSNWQYCPHYFKLVDVLRLKPWKNTPDTIFGTLLHRYCQNILENKISSEEASEEFEKKWKRLCSMYKLDKFLPYGESGKKIILEIKEAMKNYFGDFKVVKVERRISSPSGPKWPQIFRGFIDIVIELSDGKLVIIDFKTTGSSYFFVKYKTKYKDYQLTLYKHFLCLEEKINPESVETYFVLFEKDASSKKAVSLVRVTSSARKTENALKWLNAALSAINREVFIRNRSSCHLYGPSNPCVFNNSDHCPNK